MAAAMPHLPVLLKPTGRALELPACPARALAPLPPLTAPLLPPLQDQAQRAFEAEDPSRRGAGLAWPLFMKFMRRNVRNLSGEHRRAIVSYLHAQVRCVWRGVWPRAA